jgi:hypothetical protein
MHFRYFLQPGTTDFWAVGGGFTSAALYFYLNSHRPASRCPDSPEAGLFNAGSPYLGIDRFFQTISLRRG